MVSMDLRPPLHVSGRCFQPSPEVLLDPTHGFDNVWLSVFMGEGPGIDVLWASNKLNLLTN